MTPERTVNLKRLLKPRHIAFIGGRDAAIAIREARRRGFTGCMWAVNPKRTDLEGVQCVPSISDLPDVPDAVYLAIPADGVVVALRELAAIGAGGVVCFSAGFKEIGNIEAENSLKEATGDMALIGPNCYGLINYIDNTALWSFEHGGWSPGYGTAIVTQSGMFSSDITMSARSLPMAYMVSAGNQSVLGLEDFLNYFADDPAVRTIGLHIEGLQDIPAFEKAAVKAIKKGVAVVALKTGSSAIGSTLTVSHTGSLSGSNELYEALFKRCGVISVNNPAQFLETLKYLSVVDAPTDPSVVGFTCSGGGATMLADHAEKIGLTFPKVGVNGHKALRSLLPDIATVSNPLDYTTPIWGEPERTYPVFSGAMEKVAAAAALLVQDYPAAGLDASKIYYQNDANTFAKAAQEMRIPAAICSTLPENLDEETRRYLISLGIAPMQGIHEALNAIRAAATWSGCRERIIANQPKELLPSFTADELDMLTEDEGKRWLALHNINVPRGRSISARHVQDAAIEIGYPVVLKMMSKELIHKTEAGAVTLGIKNTKALHDAIDVMKHCVAEYHAKALTDNFLVEAMSPPPLAELIVNLRSDRQFGASLVLGSGGILTELVSDVITLLLPVTPTDIAQALQSLRAGQLLNGFRGRGIADINKVSLELYSLSEAFIQNRDQVAEIEINPMFIYPDHVIAVDALVGRILR